MARRRRRLKRFKPITRVGWFYPGGRHGLFCPVCGAGLWRRNGIHSRLFCPCCGWEEPQIPLENLLGPELAQRVRARQLVRGS